MKTPIGDRAGATRALVLDAALSEFATFGFRRSSIDGIARRAGVSRATVYLHWSSKEDLFRDLVSLLHEQHLDAMRAALDDPQLDLQHRLIAVLGARHLRFVQLTSSSASAAELYDVHGRLCGDIARAAETRSEELIRTLLRRSISEGAVDLGVSGLTVNELAGVLNDAVRGAKGEDPSATTPAEFHDCLTRLVRAIIHGIEPRTASTGGSPVLLKDS